MSTNKGDIYYQLRTENDLERLRIEIEDYIDLLDDTHNLQKQTLLKHPIDIITYHIVLKGAYINQHYHAIFRLNKEKFK